MIKLKLSASIKKELKRLSKKYRSLPDDFEIFVKELCANPYMGTDLGNGIHKVRMAISSKNKGKSGGARVITDTTAIISIEEGSIILLYIYDKSERESISDKEIEKLKQAIDTE